MRRADPGSIAAGIAILVLAGLTLGGVFTSASGYLLPTIFAVVGFVLVTVGLAREE